jgi:hypothetical protein
MHELIDRTETAGRQAGRQAGSQAGREMKKTNPTDLKQTFLDFVCAATVLSNT